MFVADSYDFRSSIWISKLRRGLFDWEMCDLLNLLNILEEFKLDCSKQDGWVWNLWKNDKFFTKSLYYELLLEWVFFLIKAFPLRFLSSYGTRI